MNLFTFYHELSLSYKLLKHKRSDKSCKISESSKSFTLSVTSFSHASNILFVAVLPHLAQSLSHSFLNCLSVNADLPFTSRQSVLPNDQVMSTDALSGHHAAAAAAVSENEFDKALRNCELIEVIDDTHLNLQDNIQHFNTAEDAVHQCDSDSVIRDSFFVYLMSLTESC